MQKIDFGFLGSTYIYPNLGFRTYRQHSALIPSVADLHLEMAEVPVLCDKESAIKIAHKPYAS